MVYNVFTIIIKLLLVNVLLHPRLLLFYRLKLIHATSTSDCSLDYGAVACAVEMQYNNFVTNVSQHLLSGVTCERVLNASAARDCSAVHVIVSSV